MPSGLARQGPQSLPAEECVLCSWCSRLPWGRFWRSTPALADSSTAFPATQEATNLRAGQAEPCWHAAESHRRVGRQTDRQGQAGGCADSQTGWQARPEGWDSVQDQAGAMAPACPGQAARHTMPGPRDATPSLQLERGCPAPNPTVTAFSGPRFLGDQLLSLGLPSKQAVLRGPLPSRESRAPTMCLQSGLGAVTYTVGAAGGVVWACGAEVWRVPCFHWPGGSCVPDWVPSSPCPQMSGCACGAGWAVWLSFPLPTTWGRSRTSR